MESAKTGRRPRFSDHDKAAVARPWGSCWTPAAGRRRGISAAEVLVILVVVVVVVLVLLLALPRQREVARLAACRRNLMQIGVALELYERSEGRLPTVPTLTADPASSGGPLKSLLDALVQPDLTGLTDVSRPPKPQPGRVPGERPVPGFVCPSDLTAFSEGRLPAPVSYRATAGDSPLGGTGAFAPGRSIRLAEIEDGDGRSFTAAFSERLLGRNVRGPMDYMVVDGPLTGDRCPSSAEARWRGDAGASWAEASWRSTLYNHALTPNAAPSCVADDGSSAFMGASSGHVGGVNVLIFDGSVRTVSPTVAPPVWKALATTHSPAPPPPRVEPSKEPR